MSDNVTPFPNLPDRATVKEPDWTKKFDDERDIQYAHDIWTDAIEEMSECGTLAKINALQVERYVTSAVFYRQTSEAVMITGVVDSAKAKMPVPSFKAMVDLDDLMSRHEDRLGFNPMRRAKVAVRAPKVKRRTASSEFLKG